MGSTGPNPMPGPSEIEIRRLYEMADLREREIGVASIGAVAGLDTIIMLL